MTNATPPTIGLAMIVRNAEDKLAACLDSVKDHVDQLVIVLAGESTDKTEEIARRYTDQVYAIPWRDDFAEARNVAFSKLTTDYLFWLDADDVVVNADKLHFVASEADRRGYGVLHLPYEYRHDSQGRVTVVHTRERLMKRELGWYWVNRVHEYAKCDTPHVVGIADDVVIKHTTNTANTERNARLLDLMYAEMDESHPEYPRLMGCFQDLYTSTQQWDKAITFGEKHFETVQLPEVKWTAACELARAYQGMKDYAMSAHWAHVAASILPEYSLPYLLLAHAAFFGAQDAEKALLYLEDADRRVEAPLFTFRQPDDYTVRRWETEHRSLAMLGRWDEALAVIKKAERELGLLGPDRPRTWNGWDYWSWYYLERVNCEKSIAGAFALVDHLCRRGDTLRARKLMEECLPLSIRDDPRVLRMYARIEAFTEHVFDPEKYQAFYDFNHSDTEDPNHVMNGIEYEPYRMNVLLERLRKRGARRVLDIGCGAGEPALFLAENGFEVVGLDINARSIAEANKRARKRRGKKSINIRFECGSLDTLDALELGKFDAVVMMELIEHLHPRDVPFYLSSAEDLLNPGGAVFFTTPGMAVGDIPGLWDEFPRDHVQEFSRQDLERLILASGSRRQKRPITLHKVYDPSVGVPGFASWFGEYEWEPEGADLGPEWQKPVVIYVGQGLEDWDPDSPDEVGIGGSETWAVKVARELRAKGHPVVVYAAADGVWDGVIYRTADKYNPQAPFAGARAWMCVVSRRLEMLDERPNAEHVVFVAHDTDYGDELTAERLANLDTYAVMSDWHAGHTLEKYASAPLYFELQSKLKVISNGVDLALFEGTEERVKHSFIWTSSPDRGLDHLLAWWPSIRELWPDATLDIFYGFENIDALAHQRPWLPVFKRRVLDMIRASEGVTLKGRIGQKDLAREYMRHSYWLYPSQLPEELGSGEWHETFCIAALEAAAGGCVGIFPKSGALAERPGETLHSAETLLRTLDDLDGRDYEPGPLTDWTWTCAAERLLACAREMVPA